MQVRLDKLLANRGYLSRSQARQELGRVRLNGEAVARADVKVEPGQVTWDGEPLDPAQLLLLMHKPPGYTCSHDDKGPLVYDLLPERYARRNPALSSIGRLDRDTSGVLLFCDDGTLLHRLTSPRYKLPKLYLAELDLPLLEEHIPVLSDGQIELDGERIQPARVERRADGRIALELTEGRYHQVKRMFAALGYTVQALHREAFGFVTVEGLDEGSHRFLNASEEAALRAAVGL